jgi:hypothetical protein
MNPYVPAGCVIFHLRAGTYSVNGWAFDEACGIQVGFRSVPTDTAPWNETKTCEVCIWPFPRGIDPTYRDPLPDVMKVEGDIQETVTTTSTLIIATIVPTEQPGQSGSPVVTTPSALTWLQTDVLPWLKSTGSGLWVFAWNWLIPLAGLIFVVWLIYKGILWLSKRIKARRAKPAPKTTVKKVVNKTAATGGGAITADYTEAELKTAVPSLTDAQVKGIMKAFPDKAALKAATVSALRNAGKMGDIKAKAVQAATASW